MNSNSTDKQRIRRFGIVVFVFFGALCALGVWRQKPVPACLFGFLWFLGVCFLLFPYRSRHVYAGWLKIAHVTGKTVNVFMLTLAYFLVITPSAWVKRLFGGRPLPTRPDRKASTYWVDREEGAQPRERFLKRF
jgi:hypothetical protein